MDERRGEPERVEGFEHVLEARDLPARERQVEGVGIGKVRVDGADAQPRQRVDGDEKVDGLGGVDARAAHAGVDLDVDPRRTPGRQCRTRQRAREVERGQGRLEPVLERERDLAHKERRQDPQVGLEARVAKLDALVQRGDAELAHAAGGRGARDHDGSVAVRVGLDDEQDLALRADVAADRIEVLVEDVEVDFDPRRDGHGTSGGDGTHGESTGARARGARAGLSLSHE